MQLYSQTPLQRRRAFLRVHRSGGELSATPRGITKSTSSADLRSFTQNGGQRMSAVVAVYESD